MFDGLMLQPAFDTVGDMGSTGSRKVLEVAEAPTDRGESAWRTWLEALATDAEAALGAALAYETLDDEARSAVLSVLENDSKRLAVPRVAVFAPLLSVEHDEARRERIRAAMGDDVGAGASIPARALMGSASNGDRIVVAETHVYLDFVKVTMCRLEPERRVAWLRSDPLVHVKDAMRAGSRVDGAVLEVVPVRAAVDAIARAIVGQRRHEGVLPESLRPLVELFDASDCEGNSEGNGEGNEDG